MNNAKDISSETTRTYTWADGSKVTILNPLILIVTDNGHRVEDAQRIGHYIPKGWIHLEWGVKENSKVISV